MNNKISLKESIAYYSVRGFGAFIRSLPVGAALWIGRQTGRLVYYLDFKHRRIVYLNLRIAFSSQKSTREIKRIAREVFQNYGQNLIELLRLPTFKKDTWRNYIRIEGQEHVHAALQQGKGLILLAMHFGSWELANLASTMMGYPYKVIVKPQKRYSQLDELLNEYRECGGSVTIQKGIGTRDLIRSLNNNEIVAMVMDQGGKEGIHVPFFGREASMSAGAIRLAVKMNIPVCFAVMMRERGPYHRVIIHQPIDIQHTGDTQGDIHHQIARLARLMETYINQRPAEYMWFYKIWKYSSDNLIAILDDGRTGHLRQSQAVAIQLSQHLHQIGIRSTTRILPVRFKNKFLADLLGLLIFIVQGGWLTAGRIGFIKWFLDRDSFRALMSVKADFVISCGSRTAGINALLSQDQQAKNIAILTPGYLGFNRFNLVILPEHDCDRRYRGPTLVVKTQGALNLIDEEYLEAQKQALLARFSHLKGRTGLKIGLLIGGNTKEFILNESKMKIVIHQITEVANALNADILVTTSRRTPPQIEHLLYYEWRRHPRCPLLILANRNNVDEAVGGILGLCQIVLVSSDSISMISEAACSGKQTVVFKPFDHTSGRQRQKHDRFIETLNKKGYVLSTQVENLRRAVYDLAKNKIQTRRLDDKDRIREPIKQIL